MKRFLVSYHNLSTGVRFWESTVEPEGDSDIEVARALLKESNAQLTHWDEKKRWGIFALGPLPGLIMITDDGSETIAEDAIGPRTATLMYEAAIRHPVPADPVV